MLNFLILNILNFNKCNKIEICFGIVYIYYKFFDKKEKINYNINKEILETVTQDLALQKEVLADIKNRLARAEATWDMAENIFQQLADQVRRHEYDIKDLSR